MQLLISITSAPQANNKRPDKVPGFSTAIGMTLAFLLSLIPGVGPWALLILTAHRLCREVREAHSIEHQHPTVN